MNTQAPEEKCMKNLIVFKRVLSNFNVLVLNSEGKKC